MKQIDKYTKSEINKEEELTYERAIEILRYDSETGVLERKLKSGRWRACGHRSVCRGYGRVGVDGKGCYTHRLIWFLVYREWPEVIDHIDRNKMNNRIDNLRDVTKSENEHNRGLRRDNSSGYPGVYFFKHTNKYRARISKNGKRISLGLYDTPEEAFTVYMLAKIKYHPSSPDAQEYFKELTLAG